MSSHHKAEILLVEDNKNDKMLILRELKKYNIDDKILPVKNGEEALDFIFATGRFSERNAHNTPKMVILDLKLPKVNGLEVLKKIKSDEVVKTIPVVVFTSSREEKDRQESYRLGANSFIIKPINYEKFSDVVSEIGYYWLYLNQPAN